MSTALTWQPGPAHPPKKRVRKPRSSTRTVARLPYIYMVRPIVRSLIRELGLEATPENESIVRRHIDKARKRRAGR